MPESMIQIIRDEALAYKLAAKILTRIADECVRECRCHGAGYKSSESFCVKCGKQLPAQSAEK